MQVVYSARANMAPYVKFGYSQPKEAAPLLVNVPVKLVTTSGGTELKSPGGENKEEMTSPRKTGEGKSPLTSTAITSKI